MSNSLKLNKDDFVNNPNAINIFGDFWLLNDTLFSVNKKKVENINDQWDDFLKKVEKKIANNKKAT
jgi:hypothetical protein